MSGEADAADDVESERSPSNASSIVASDQQHDDDAPAREEVVSVGGHDERGQSEGSPVPAFFTADQVASLIATLFAGITSFKPLSATVNITEFIDTFPLFAEGDFAELQQNTFTSVQQFFKEYVVTRRTSSDGLTSPGAATATNIEGDTTVEVPSSLSRAQSAGGRAGQSLPPSRATMGSAPVQRRNPVVASHIAAAAKPSLYRPQTAGSASTASATPSEPPATMHVVTMDSTELAVHLAGGPTQAALPQPVSRPATSSARPQSSSNHNKTGAELAVKTFTDVERQLKDERGQNRFAFTEYQVEDRVEDHAVVDRRQKSIQTNAKDLELLHNLDPHRRQYMMQLFNDPDMMAKRKKRLEAEELLREVRQAQASSVNAHPTSSGRKSSPLRTTDAAAVSRETSPLPPHRRPSSVQPAPSKKWESANNELEVWNAVRTRPPSAAASLPFDSPAPAATSTVARLIPRPQSTEGAAHTVTRDARAMYNMSFAEMVAQRRDSLHLEGGDGGRSTATAGDATGSSRQPPLSPPTPSLSAESNAKKPSATTANGSSSGRTSTKVSVIGVGDLGFHPKAETLVRTVEVGVGSSNELPYTTITTAAYIPMAHKAPPSASLSQRESQPQVGGKLSRSRAKIDAIKQSGDRGTSLSDVTHTVETGTTHRQAVMAKSSSAKSAASAVATAAAIRVKRADSASPSASNKKASASSVEPWPL